MKNMNSKRKQFWENFFIQKIRYSNRSGLHKNCIRIFPNNSDIHEDTKYFICKKLIKQGYSVWTEAIFGTGQRADIVAVNGRYGYIIEIETKKSLKELDKKIEQKEKYPKDFELVIVNTENFNINSFEL